MSNVDKIEDKVWYVSDSVIIVTNKEDGKIYAFPTVEDPTKDDWEKVLKVINKIGMQAINNRLIIDGKECIEVKEI